MKVKETLSVAKGVFARSLPYLGIALVSNVHPSLAATTAGTGLGGIATGATSVQNAATQLGFAMAIGGVAFGGIHWAAHRDQWLHSAQILGGGIAAGYITANAPAIAQIGGGGALLN